MRPAVIAVSQQKSDSPPITAKFECSRAEVRHAKAKARDPGQLYRTRYRIAETSQVRGVEAA
jgi:hypothetical protein